MKRISAFRTALQLKTIALILCACISSVSSFSQAIITIDGVNTTFSDGLSLPYWLKAGQSVGLVSNVKSISIIEFTADSNNLTFSKVISLTGSQTVPSGKVWKIEALGLGINGQTAGGFSTSTIPTIFTSPKTFSTAGTFTWIVPPGVTNICIEVWGGGGTGATVTGIYAGAGGGGGYGYQCFSVVPGASYVVVVGGSAGSSSVGSLISANGGANGVGTVGGAGGTSSATFNISGTNGGGSAGDGGNGGNGGNGGAGGGCYGSPGAAPGGGAGGRYYNAGTCLGGAAATGAIGRVIIYW